MASQSDTLSLAASVVDQFSKPLADLTRQLKAFSSLEQTTSQRGKRVVDEHWKSYRELALQSKITSENVKRLLTPAIEGLGLSTIIATRSLGSFSAALKELGGHAQTLEFLKEQTGLSTQKIREFEEAGKRVGISYEQTDSALRKFAENLNQYKKGKGDFITNFIGQPADVLAFVRSLAGKTAEEAADAVRQKLASTKGEERALYARLFELPENMGQETDAVFARVRKNLGVLSEQSESDLAEMNQSWFDLKEAIEGASNSIEARFAPALAGAYKDLAEFSKQHPYIALIAASFASMSGSILQMAGGIAILKGVFGGRAAAAAPAAAGAGGLGILGALGALGIYGGAAAGAGSLLQHPGHALGGSGWEALKRLWYGEDTFTSSAAAATDPRFGLGAGHRALMARGTPEGLGTEVRDKEAVSKSVSTGAKEGVLAAFYQWFSDPSHRGGIGEGGAGGETPSGGGGGISPGIGGGGVSPSGGGPGGTPVSSIGSVATPGGLTSLLTPKSGGSASTATAKIKALITPRTPGGSTPITYRGGGRSPPEPVAGIPYTAGEMEGALGTDQAHYDAFRNALAGIESGKRGYNLLGGSGGHFAGRYQMGALGGHTELQETAHSLGEATPSVQEFLRDPKMQERFFERYTLNHHKYLMANSPEYAKLSPNEKLAALGYAHNQGAGNAAKYLRTGQVGHDAFGTSGDTYIRAIRRAEEKVGSTIDKGRRSEETKPDAAQSAADRMKEDFARRGWKIPPEPNQHSGLDTNIRQHMASIVKHEGHAKVSIDFRNMPKGIKTAASSSGVFKEVKLIRGRAMSADA